MAVGRSSSSMQSSSFAVASRRPREALPKGLAPELFELVVEGRIAGHLNSLRIANSVNSISSRELLENRATENSRYGRERGLSARQACTRNLRPASWHAHQFFADALPTRVLVTAFSVGGHLWDLRN
jgi:hypothetical protein